MLMYLFVRRFTTFNYFKLYCSENILYYLKSVDDILPLKKSFD